jgi:hypothetical protein
VPCTDGHGGGEEAHGGAGIAEEQRLGRQLQFAMAGDHEGGVVRLVDGHAHLAQGHRHVAGVIALQGAAQAAGALGQGGQQQGTVGNGFGAGGATLPLRGNGRCNGHGFCELRYKAPDSRQGGASGRRALPE